MMCSLLCLVDILLSFIHVEGLAMYEPRNNPIFFVLGATGTGKSTAAVTLALILKDEFNYSDVAVINCDVMQFYNFLPLATNIMTMEAMMGIEHYFMGFLNPDDSFCSDPESPYRGCGNARSSLLSTSTGCSSQFNVHCYTERVLRFIDSYFSRKTNAALIICGGTCYYLQALLFQNTLIEETHSQVDSGALHNLENEKANWFALNEIDPDIALLYHPNDRRRIQRMLEIHKETGKKPSELFSLRAPSLRFPINATFVVWTCVDVSVHVKSLDERVDRMMELGLVEEVRRFQQLLKLTELRTSITGAIGFKEFSDLEKVGAGDTSSVIACAIEKVKSSTRRYAKQQDRWIGNRIIPLMWRAKFPRKHFVKVHLEHYESAKECLREAAGALLKPGSYVSVVFPLEQIPSERAAIIQERCPICDTIIYGRDQLTVHLKSKRHRGAVKRKVLEERHRRLFGVDLPPPKRRKKE